MTLKFTDEPNVTSQDVALNQGQLITELLEFEGFKVFIKEVAKRRDEATVKLLSLDIEKSFNNDIFINQSTKARQRLQDFDEVLGITDEFLNKMRIAAQPEE